MNTRTAGLLIHLFLCAIGVSIGIASKQPICSVIGLSSGFLIYIITMIADDICKAIKALKK
jgi:hypothetical protein